MAGNERQSSKRIVVGAFASVLAFTSWKLITATKKHFSKKDDCTITISDLFIYPLKSCKATRVSTAVLTNGGLKYDREWMVYDAQTKYMCSQRQMPCMALICPKLSFDESMNCDGICLEAPNMTRLFIPVAKETADNRVTKVKIFGHYVAGTDQGDEASQWLSKYINDYRLSLFKDHLNNNKDNNKTFKAKEYRLLRILDNNPNLASTNMDFIPTFLGGAMECKMVEKKGAELERSKKKEDVNITNDGTYESQSQLQSVDKEFRTHITFADGMPILIVSKSSLNELNRRLILQNEEPVTMNRFRPNIVICGRFKSDNNCNDDVDRLEPFFEDKKEHLTICRNGLTFYLTKPCARCSIPTIDQNTGEKNPQIRKTLFSFRTGKQLKLSLDEWQDEVFFAMNACNDSCGTVRVGDCLK